MQRQRVSEPANHSRRQIVNKSSNEDRLIERDALYAEFAPVVNRLLRKHAVVTVMPGGIADEIYSRFCELFDNYDPNHGVPLRPYLVRHLSSSVFDNAPSHLIARQREANLGVDARDLDHAEFNVIPPVTDPDRAPTQFAGSLPAAMQRLPDHEQRVVVWRYYENRSFEDIAQLLGVDASTAMSLLTRGLSNLRMMMHDR